MRMISATFATVFAFALSFGGVHAQSEKPGVEKLYILSCGEGVAGDISLWSPGVNEGKSMDFVDGCYLIKHKQGWFLWDTGLPDSVAALPNGLPPANPKTIYWHRAKTLAAQLAELNVAPSDIKKIAVSHTHPDHIGNVELFPQAMLYVQKAEYEWPNPDGTPRFKPEHPVTKVEGDLDVFGDGSIVLLAAPGHTPGHQVLLVKLAKTGNIVLSGDLAHFMSNWENRGVPTFNTSKEQTYSSMQRIADILKKENATLWINHDKVQRDGQKLSPQFYD
jgi:N-acyl homoserine lactone hydrolase